MQALLRERAFCRNVHRNPGLTSQHLASQRRTSQHLGLALTVGLHIAFVVAMLAWEPARSSLAAIAPIMVNLITPPASMPQVEKPKQAPKAQPARAKDPPPAPPQMAASEHSPAPAAQAAPAPAAVIAAPTPAPAPLVVVETAAPAAPPPIQAPRFDAAYLDNPAPAYPLLARRMKEQGKVTLRVLVSAAGLAERIEIRASSGSERLDLAAQETVKRWRFVPAKQGADAVSAWVLVPISFSLES